MSDFIQFPVMDLPENFRDRGVRLPPPIFSIKPLGSAQRHEAWKQWLRWNHELERSSAALNKCLQKRQ